MLIVHRDVRWEINFIRLSHDGVTLDVSTAILLVFIRRWRIALLLSKRRDQHPELYPGWCYRKVIFIKMALEQNTSAGRRIEYNSKLETTIGTLKTTWKKPKRSPTDKRKKQPNLTTDQNWLMKGRAPFKYKNHFAAKPIT